MWSDSFWATPHSGPSGWLVCAVAGATLNFGNLALARMDWQDSGGNPFSAARPGASFALVQDGSDIYLNYLVAIPEPGMALLVFVGMGILVLVRPSGGRTNGHDLYGKQMTCA